MIIKVNKGGEKTFYLNPIDYLTNNVQLSFSTLIKSFINHPKQKQKPIITSNSQALQSVSCFLVFLYDNYITIQISYP